MFRWNKYPLLRIVLPWVAGIVLVFQFSIRFPMWTLLFAAGGGILLMLLSYYFRKHQTRWTTGIFITITLLSLSICYTQLFIDNGKPPIELTNEKKHTFIASVIESPVEKTKSVKLVVRIESYKNDSNQWKSSNTKAVLHLQKDEFVKDLNYGDKLIFHTFLNEPFEPSNPQSFDYKRYLSMKNIYLQSYVNSEAWTKVSERNGSFIMHFAVDTRNKFLKIFRDCGMEPQQYGIISALLLGFDDELDPDLSRSYSSAGVSHILCVSGMHVGIIYMIVSFFLKLLDKTRTQRIFRTFILLGVVWFYACITGLSPSVMRASTMFTFVAVAGLLNRRTNSYNSLLTSMFFLLCINPLVVFNVGFEFSYLAVFGIVWLQRPVKSLYTPKTKVGNHVWEIISVSFVAQLFTAPLAILYFHQFPNYFLIANIVVITLTPVIVGFGIAVLVFSFWAFAYKYLSLGLMYLIKIMNWFILSIEKLPNSLTENISISSWQVMLAYLFILFFICALLYKNKTYLFQALGCGIIILGLDIFAQLQINRQQEIHFYSVRSGYVIDFMDGQNSILWGNNITLNDQQSYDFNIKNNHIRHRITQLEKIENLSYFQFHTKKVLVLNKPVLYIPQQEKLKADYVLLTGNFNISLDNLLKMVDFNTLLTDGTYSYYRIENISKDCAQKAISYHDLKNQGALTVKLR